MPSPHPPPSPTAGCAVCRQQGRRRRRELAHAVAVQDLLHPGLRQRLRGLRPHAVPRLRLHAGQMPCLQEEVTAHTPLPGVMRGGLWHVTHIGVP